MKTSLKSAIYEGTVNHTRIKPKWHSFNYSLFMLYLDLEELDTVFSKSWLWSYNKFNVACFLLKDYFEDESLSLDRTIRDLVKEKTGNDATGPIRVLTNLRYFGYIINPITCFYCFDEQEKLQYIVVQVTNTPWKERAVYVLPCHNELGKVDLKFSKKMHVSPFLSMNMEYVWSSDLPNDDLSIYMETCITGDCRQKKILSATLKMQKRAVSNFNLNLMLMRHPFMTAWIATAIYWEALRLLWKKVPFFSNPQNKNHLIMKQKNKERSP